MISITGEDRIDKRSAKTATKLDKQRKKTSKYSYNLEIPTKCRDQPVQPEN